MEFHEALVRGHALWSHGQLDDAESALLSVDRDGPWYAHACVLLARVCASRGQVPFRVDHYLSAFLRRPPTTSAEQEALALLEPLYRAQGLVEAADELVAMRGAHVAGDGAEGGSFEGDAHPTALLPELPSIEGRHRAAIGDEDVATVVDQHQGEVARRAAPATSVDQVFTMRPAARPTTPTPPSPPPPAPTPAEAAAPAAPPKAVKLENGHVLSGRYRLGALLGRGGMATVYKATDLELGEEVAVKVFASASLGPSELERFKRELRVARKLRHPNIVQLYDLGVADGQYFISMELLHGRDLASTLRQAGGRLEVPLATRLLRSACAGLQAAHEQGVVHRDIKPANLFIEEGGALKVMDFGVAKATVDDVGVQTRTGMVLGTPQYMAPEQAQDSAHVTTQCDLYALGVVAFELLCGRRPFDGGGLVSILMAHVNNPPPAPRSLNADLPAALEAVILRCLAKAPADRFPTAAALSDALAPFAA